MAEDATWIAIATGGLIAGYDVVIAGDSIMVLTADTVMAQRRVDGLGTFVDTAKDLRLGWARFDEFDVIYVYDKADQNFCYALNLQIAHYSEWGYAPFDSTRVTDR